MLTLKDVPVVATVSGVTILNIFLSGALTVALPTIGKDLDLSEANLQWPVTIFSLAYGCTLLLFGRIGDILGGRFMFLVGSGWFSAWSIGASQAHNLATLTVCVAMLGLGAAANTPAGMAIIVSRFPPGSDRNLAFGVLGAGQPLGYILGLVLGGIFSQSHLTWRGIFYIQAGLGLIFVASGYLCLEPEPLATGKHYTKGLDWGGAFFSTAGIGLLTYSLAASASAPQGWRSPYIIGLTCASVLILIIFWFYEKWREQKSASVLMPPSIWSHPGARMPATIAVVFFTCYQQVNGLSPLQASVRFIPTIICAIGTNLAGGWVMNRVPGLPLILGAVTMNVKVAALLFALLDIHASFWAMAFWVMILLAGADLVYPACTLQVLSACDDDSKSLAGGIFVVATRLATSIGMPITFSITTAVSQKFHLNHPELSYDSPDVLMAGFRAGGWTLCAAAGIAFIIALIGLRGIGIVGHDGSAGENGKTELQEAKEVTVEQVV
ncbi:major facilitator superfamily-domain-containing protein [Mycena vulgaris]|nr:major facilitator superfamily-domain-containing protein [Mycena vulgaris]